MPAIRRLFLLFPLVLAALGTSGCGDDAEPNVIVGRGDVDAPDGSLTAPDDCNAGDLSYEGFVAPLFEARCLGCHSASLEGDARFAAPAGVDFDTADDVAYHQERIAARAVDERSMPPSGPLDDCDASKLQSYLDGLDGQGACEPDCSAAECGDDGCGGSCGECGGTEYCSQAGTCVAADCSPSCQGVACGDDGCGGSCGACGPGLQCGIDGQCECAPQCDGLSCGDDGCGGSCGECGSAEICGQAGQCLCIPACETGQQCGDDGCGGSCGSCGPGNDCNVTNTCECVPDCAPGQQCGDDGCGGSCGSCMGALTCNTRMGRCVASCTPDCGGRECGDDGCGGSCGPCDAGLGCTDSGQCECIPDCVGKSCGDDGCGGSCGGCTDGLACDGGRCGCTASCDGRMCGSDGCGGSCGSCDAGESCDSDGQCVAQCEPSCAADQQCGDDGCGGSCGACSGGTACQDGACVAADVGFGEVYAILQSYGCGSMACHGGINPSEGLDLSSEAGAESALVGVEASQCSDGRLLTDPGDPANSYIIQKLTGVGMCSGSRMPKSGGGLSAAEIDTIRAWIVGL
jgi:hypothetical protein